MKSIPHQRALQAAAIATAIACAFPLHAQAQSNTANTVNLTPVVVTAARMPQSAKEVLTDTVVITAEELRDSGQRTLADVLQQKRGIEISRSGGPASATSVFIRGTANNQSVVLVDGVRIGSSTLGGATWESIPLSQVDHVEIVYGPLSSLYGADAMGGVVQIFTKQGNGAPGGSVSAGAGSDGLRQVEAGLSGSGSGVRYALLAAHEKADGISASKAGAGSFTYNPDRDGYRKTSASGQLGVDLAPGHALGLNFLRSRVKSQFDAGLGFDDHGEQELGSLAITSQNQWNKDWRSVIQLARSTDDSKTFASYGNGFINTRQNLATWQNDLSFGPDVLQLVIERRVEKVETDTFGLAGERRTNSLAASYHLRRAAHQLSLSARNDDSSQFGSHRTGSLEYGYRINPDWRVTAGAGTSFRAPTFNELYYPGYGISTNRPEEGRNIQFGAYFARGDHEFSAVAYRNRLTDLIVYAPVCPVQVATHAFGCAYNINRAELTGLSLSASQRFGSLFLRGSLDFQDPQDETTGKQLARRARKHGSVSLEYAANGLKAGVETVLSGQRFDDIANTSRIGGYGVVNLYASQQLAGGWSVFGRANNIGDKDYELVKNYTTPGRNYFVGLRYAM